MKINGVVGSIGPGPDWEIFIHDYDGYGQHLWEKKTNTNTVKERTMGYKERQLEIRENNFNLIVGAISNELYLEFTREYEDAKASIIEENKKRKEYSRLLDIDKELYKLDIEKAGLGSFQAKRREQIEAEIESLKEEAYEIAKSLFISRYNSKWGWISGEEIVKKQIKELIKDAIEIGVDELNKVRVSEEGVRARLLMLDWEDMSYDDVKQTIKDSIRGKDVV